MPEQYTLEEFGKRIKAKYPQYGSLSDTDIANKVLAKYPQYKSSIKAAAPATTTKAPEKSITERLTEIQPHQMPHSAADVGREVVKGVGNIGAAGMSVLAHPIDTLESAGKFALRVSPPGELIDTLRGKPTASDEFADQIVHHPLETAETAIGQAGATEGAGEVLRGTVKGVKAIGGRTTEVATKTTPSETEDLVKNTRAENEAAAAKVAEQNTKQAEAHAKAQAEQTSKRNAAVRKHGEKLSEARQAATEKQGQISRKVALQRGVEKLDSGLKDDLKATETRVNAEANQKYNDLRAKLKDEEAPAYQPLDAEGHVEGEPMSIVERLYESATGPLRGREQSLQTEPPILKSLSERLKHGDVTMTYNDLQGYREEIGRELRKGTLPPDVFTGYKGMMADIDTSMKQIADRHGLGGAQDAARNFYRRYAEAFIDRDSPIRKALDSTERGQVTKSFGGKDQSGIQRLAQFNPELAKSINTVRGYAEEARRIRATGTTPKEPTLTPKPTPLEAPKPATAEPKKINRSDIREAKGEGLGERTKWIRKHGGWVAAWPLFHIMSQIVHGDIVSVPMDLAASGATFAGVQGIARVLENPTVVDFLTKANARDIAQVPADLRGDLPSIVETARKRGIKISPALLGAVMGSRNYPRGPNTRKLESLRGNSQTTQP